MSSRDGAAGSDATFAASVPWFTWKLIAAAAAALWVVLFVLGGVRLLRLRTAGGGSGDGQGDRLRGYVPVALAVVTCVVVLLTRTGSAPFEIPVSRFELLSRGLLIVAAVCVTPWLVSVWVVHGRVRDLDARIEGLDSNHTAPTRQLTIDLLERWGDIRACVGAFGLFVASAIVTSGALRAAYVAHVGADTPLAGLFPASYVLLFGLFFTAVLAVIAWPLLNGWRRRVNDLVDRRYPIPADGELSQEWVDARRRLGDHLGLDVPLLRNPLTALSVFLPLVTAALATLVPQLAG